MNGIPFNRPFIAGKELYYIAQAVQGGHLAGDGPFTRKCNEWMERAFGAHKAILTHSGTAALDICALLCDIGPEDEVIMPSFTFVSTANAFALRGAQIRFVDIRPDTLNIDERLVESAITSRTKVIVPVHYAGVGCEMDSVLAIARKHDLIVVEDAAQGVAATYKDSYLGTMGHLGAYSFHETKNFISGEGGALLVNDESLAESAETICEKGTDRNRFLRGETDRYTWVRLGSSFLPSEIVAAFLYAQLEEAATISQKRNEIHRYYRDELSRLGEGSSLRLPVCPPECQHNAHLFCLITATHRERDALIAHLKSRDIGAVFHYVPLHTSPVGLKMGNREGDLPVTEDLSQRLVRLPCYYELTKDEQDRIIDNIYGFYGEER